jgi:Zn finger protein HypA/HybF involved in hydrogenase expression
MITNNHLELYSLILLLLALILGTLLASYLKRIRGVGTAGSSVLLTYYCDGVDLLPIGEGKIGGMHFSSFITSDANILIYRVELPFSSKVHLLGVPKIEGGIMLDPSKGKTLMNAVELEGDYVNYFALYAEKGQQVQARYVLDPKAMAFTVDFCKSHNWEIINNELYFLQDISIKTNDPTIMFDDIVKFVNEIRPVVEQPLTEKEIKYATPYGKDRRAKLKCPICSKIMANNEEYYSCPDDHGILINGRYLARLSDGELYLKKPIDPNKSVGHKELACPSCGTIMQRVEYNGGKQNIDSCNKCPYRWLDSIETNKL